MKYSLSKLNRANQKDFIAALGGIFEDSPWVAARAWQKRPFEDLDSLHQGMVAVVNEATPAEQLQLIRIHPDLGNKAEMTDASVEEQAGVGLNRLNSEEYDRFQALNRAYKTKFGFPFIMAVKKHTKESILEAFETRLENSVEVERQQALAEIAQIARFRLYDLVGS